MVNVYKGKGNALECSSYRGIKLLEHVLKVLERVIEARLRKTVKIDEMQFGFCPGKGTTDAIFIVRQVQEKFLGKQKEMWMAFVDLEKAFDRVPREVLWWALRHVGVEEWMVNVIKSLYEGVTTAVRRNGEESESFEVKVGVHQGSVLSPILFNIVMQAIADNFKKGLPWELLYADDLVLLAESRLELEERLTEWMARLKEKGLRVNIGKTKVMNCKVGVGQVENSGKYLCGVCREGVGDNAIRCTSCKKWIHKRCSRVVGRLAKVAKVGDFKCRNCSGDGVKVVDEVRQVVLGAREELEVVDKFCYLGDVIGKGGGAEEASRARVRCAWGKFRDLRGLLTARGASLKVKGKIYRACVQRVLVYGSETWPMKAVDMRRLVRTENSMVRWMSGVTLKDRRKSEELRRGLGIESVDSVVSRGMLRWFGHVERKEADDWVSKCRHLEVGGGVRKGGNRKTWMKCVKDDMRKRGLKKEDAQDRTYWRDSIVGNV